MSQTARVWKIYYDEAQQYDDEKLQEYNQSIDVLLVFVSYGRCSGSSLLIQRRVAYSLPY